jgi:hypothetical protein
MEFIKSAEREIQREVWWGPGEIQKPREVFLLFWCFDNLWEGENKEIPIQ